MQNVQNAAEIQQRVINLVDFYRTKVGKESQIAIDAKEIYEKWKEANKNAIQFSNIDFPDKKSWIKHLQVNEQLLGHFYYSVAGKDAEVEVLSQLLPDFYDTTVYSEEEESFLSSHFREMVNYIIQTPINDLEILNCYESKDENLLPKEVLELITKQVEIPAGSVIFNPTAAVVQLTTLFKDCKILCGGQGALTNAWAKIAAYANGIDAKIIDLSSIPESYDVLLFHLPTEMPLPDGMDLLLCHMYDNLKVGGKIILISPSYYLAKCKNNEKRRFWHNLVDGREVSKIIQLPDVMYSDYNIVIANKKTKNEKCTFIDARFATAKGKVIYDPKRKKYWDTLDMASYDKMIKKNGGDPLTGEKRMVKVDSSSVDVNMLLPEYYLMKKPANDDNPLPLSSLCTFVKTKRIGNLNFDLPLETPWLKYGNLSYTYHGPIDLEKIEQANCPNNPMYSEDMKSDFNEFGEFIDDFLHLTSKGQRIYEYRNSYYINGKSSVVFVVLDDLGAKTCVVLKGKPYASKIGESAINVYAFTPKKGVNTYELLFLLRMPIVYNQIKFYSRYGGLACHIDEVLVPFDERIKRDCRIILEAEEKEYNEQKDYLISLKTDYINEVRMRKHDMRPYMKQLNSAKNLMQHYIDNMNSIDDVKTHLNHQLTRFNIALSSLSTIIEHLSDEEKFGEPVLFSIKDYFEKITKESGEGNITLNIDVNTIEKYFTKKGFTKSSGDRQKRAHLTGKSKDVLNSGQDLLNCLKLSSTPKDEDYMIGKLPVLQPLIYVYIAPIDFDRMVQNVIENARVHGFTDLTRTDYMIWIKLSIDEKRDMYQIDIINNGTPLPEGMSKTRYGIRGEKAGFTGGTGSGGFIVKTIVNHYGGDYDVFCQDGLTTVRILLPIVAV